MNTPSPVQCPRITGSFLKFPHTSHGSKRIIQNRINHHPSSGHQVITFIAVGRSGLQYLQSQTLLTWLTLKEGVDRRMDIMDMEPPCWYRNTVRGASVHFYVCHLLVTQSALSGKSLAPSRDAPLHPRIYALALAAKL